MKTAKRYRFLSPAMAILIVCLAPVLCNAEESDIDWDNASPSLIHQKLSEGKASSFLDRQFVRTMATASTDENTQTNYDVLFYDINIRVNDTTEILYGIVKMVAIAAIDGVTQVQVDLQFDMVIDSLKSSTGTLAFSRNGDVVTVILDATRNRGEQFVVSFYYNGHPTEGGFQGFSFSTRYSSKVISSLSEPYFARTWWPCKDRMDDKADSFNIAITVDTFLYVASNGKLDSTVAFGANAHTFHWSVRYPMVTYLFSVAISNYTVWTDEWIYNAGQDTMPIMHAVYPDLYDNSLTKYDITPYALTVLSDKYGEYPFVNEKYGHANFEWSGAMEHQTMSSMSGTDFGFSETVVVHEMAHQWFGNMITCRAWGHVWLNEGWASYAEADYYLEKYGWDFYHNYMNEMAYTGSGTIYVEDLDTTEVGEIFHGGLSYDKGAWVVHMLRGVLGDQKFYDGVEAYYNSEFQYASATTEDFRNVFEKSSGQQLDWFFEDWIYGTCRPNYQFRYLEEISDSGGYDLYLIVEQAQTTDPQVFRMPVDFFFDFVSLPDDTVQLWPDERRNMFIFNLPTRTNSIQCDPSDWVLKNESHEPWQLHFVTPVEGLSDGAQYYKYSGTIRAIGGSNSLNYTLTDGTLPSGYSLIIDGTITGTTPDTGLFTFTVHVDDKYGDFFDDLEYSLYIVSTELIPGDIDLNFSMVNISDLTFLIDFMFTGGPYPLEMNVADVNADCQVDISDLVYMVNFMFLDGPVPLLGCVIGKTEWPGSLTAE